MASLKYEDAQRVPDDADKNLGPSVERAPPLHIQSTRSFYTLSVVRGTRELYLIAVIGFIIYADGGGATMIPRGSQFFSDRVWGISGYGNFPQMQNKVKGGPPKNVLLTMLCFRCHSLRHYMEL